MTNLTMPNNFSFIRYAQKTVPGIADVGVPHGDEGPSQGLIGMAGIHPDVIGVRNFFLNDLSNHSKQLLVLKESCTDYF